jgi:transcriptional regulator with XRE-family HTH domain
VKFSQIELALSPRAAAEIEVAVAGAHVAGRLRNSDPAIGQTALEDLLVVMLASVISLRAAAADVDAATTRCSERLSKLLEVGRTAGLDLKQSSIADQTAVDVPSFRRVRTAMTPVSIDIVVGRRLRLLRLLASPTPDELARCLGIDDAQKVAQYEAGEVSLRPKQIAELVDKLQVPLHWFFLGLEDDALELCVAEEVERALQNRTEGDLPFVAQFSELFDSYRALGPTEDRTRIIAQARVLVAQRIAAAKK